MGGKKEEEKKRKETKGKDNILQAKSLHFYACTTIRNRTGTTLSKKEKIQIIIIIIGFVEDADMVVFCWIYGRLINACGWIRLG